MIHVPDSLKQLIDQLSQIPGIGKKSARRIAFFLLKQPREKVLNLARSIVEIKEKIIRCSICNNISEINPCQICRNQKRNRRIICVVEDAADIYAIERTNEFNGLYHVLDGYIAPLDNVGPEDLNIDSLVKRAKEAEEVILALNPGRDREMTVTYLTRLLQQCGVRVTRLAMGIPIGGDVEYADEVTLQRAISNRIRIN